MKDSEPPSQDDITAFQLATRDLVGLALHSLELLEGEVSLPQFRMMTVLADVGRTSSSSVAKALRITPSSVTRLGDRLEASGHVTRGHDARSRSVVTLELTKHGADLVEQVMERRREELGRVLAKLSPDERACAAAVLRHFHEAAAVEPDHSGPVPL